MNSPKDIKKYPKFVKVNAIQPQQSWNKYLLKPYQFGEVCKVAPINEQVSYKTSTLKDVESIKKFRSQYVKIYRKDEEGNYTLPYVAQWRIFELLTTKMISK